jgi:succinyl-CoA synthetase beta subunit
VSSTESDLSGDLGKLVQIARAQNRRVLSEPEAKAFLRAQDIPVPDSQFVRSPDEAGAALSAIGGPVVVKAVAPLLTHKNDAGGVIFPVASPAAAEEACRTITRHVKTRRPDIALDGFLIEAFRPSQPEWIMALRTDSQFGPVIMFGLGGVLVEALRQVSFRLAPLTATDITALLTEHPATKLLNRKGSQTNGPGLSAVLKRLSELSELPEVQRHINEIEINPIVVSERGPLALDALIVLRS